MNTMKNKEKGPT